MDKFYGYGIVDKDCDGYDLFLSEEDACERAEELNRKGHYKPYRPVELFYKDEQSPCAHHHTCGTWNAEKQAYEKWVCLDCKKDLGADYYTKKQAAAKEQP